MRQSIDPWTMLMIAAGSMTWGNRWTQNYSFPARVARQSICLSTLDSMFHSSLSLQVIYIALSAHAAVHNVNRGQRDSINVNLGGMSSCHTLSMRISISSFTNTTPRACIREMFAQRIPQIIFDYCILMSMVRGRVLDYAHTTLSICQIFLASVVFSSFRGAFTLT
jgi:hypothetical protein